MSWKETHKQFVDKKIQNLTLNKLVLGSVVEIENKTFTVIGKALYDAGIDWYYKIFLSDKHLLAFTFADNETILFGKEIDLLPYDPPFPDQIEYSGKTFIKNLVEHQVVNEHFFGEIEHECDFWDYSNDKENISIAILTDSNKRADVYSKDIAADDIKIIKS